MTRDHEREGRASFKTSFWALVRNHDDAVLSRKASSKPQLTNGISFW